MGQLEAHNFYIVLLSSLPTFVNTATTQCFSWRNRTLTPSGQGVYKASPSRGDGHGCGNDTDGQGVRLGDSEKGSRRSKLPTSGTAFGAIMHSTYSFLESAFHC